LALLVVTVFFAGAALVIKYKLEDLRAVFEDQAENRLGVDLGLGKVQVNGLRGLIIQDLHTVLPIPGGPSLEIRAPITYVYVNLIDFLYGQVTIDRLQVDDAEIEVVRRAGGDWLETPAEGRRPAPRSGTASKPTESALAFRVLGKNCTFRARNVAAGTNIEISALDFDALRLKDSLDYSVRLAGNVNGAEEKRLALNLRFASIEDFDLRLQTGLVTADDVNIFLPASQHFVTSGSLRPSMRVAGYPGGALVVSLDAAFDDIAVRDQPDFVPPISGTLTALADYNLDTNTLTLTTAQAISDQLSGRVEGSISLEGEHPAFDLRLHTNQLPLEQALSYGLSLAGAAAEEVNVALPPTYAIDLSLTGTTESPVLALAAAADTATLRYAPKDKSLPTATVEIAGLRAGWNSSTGLPSGSASVRGGRIEHAATGLTAQDLSGTVTFADNAVQIDAITASIRGNPFVGQVRYDTATGNATFTANGSISSLETTPLGTDVEDLTLAGTIGLRCTGKISKNHYTIDASIDGTQAEVGFEWWFLKPIGIGLNVNGLNVDVVPNKSIKIVSQALLDTVPISANIDLRYRKGTYQLDTIRAKAERVDAATADKCLRVPYTLGGGVATNLTLNWKRTDEGPDTKTFTIAGNVEAATALPRGAAAPIVVSNAAIEVTINDGLKGNRTGSVSVLAEQGSLPAFGDVMFLPIEPETPELKKKYESEPRSWTYNVTTKAISIPPWRGTGFSAKGSNINGVTEISPFQGTVGDGTVSGVYRIEEADNLGSLKAKWQDVPAHFLIDHLKLPAALTGLVSGEIDYAMDNDDPGTLKGYGRFEVRDGQFSWDYMLAQFKDRLATELASLPSLKFSRLAMDVALDGDRMHTKNIELNADGITITGDGTYVTEGDMDYTLKVAIAPATAERIPILRDSFNIEGHRLTANNIELSFRVSGPAFNPRGQVAGLPSVGVTLVSGAAEMTSEALKVIDLPRQILLDLFKIGGAVVGPPRQSQ